MTKEDSIGKVEQGVSDSLSVSTKASGKQVDTLSEFINERSKYEENNNII